MQEGPPARERMRIDWTVVAVAAAGAALFHFKGNANAGYIDTESLFYWWGFQWLNPASESEHGILIAGLSLFLLWRNLRAAPPATTTPPGRRLHPAFLIGAALVLHAAGFVMQQARISILALLLFLQGLAALHGGERWRRAAFFPIAFLVFAIPLNVLDTIGFWLRMGVIATSATIAQAAGVDVLRSGTLLVAPDGRYQYDVAASCSGVRSLMAFAALSLLLGYLNLASRRLRAVVFLSCLPFVFLGNVARITSIIFAAQWGGPAWGDRAHDVMGWGVFVIVLGGVYAVATVVRRYDPAPLPPAAGRTPAPAVPSPAWGRTAAALVGLIAIEIAALHWVATLPPRGGAGVNLAADGANPVELPAFLGSEWIGRPTPVTQAERDVLPPDTGYSRRQYVSLRQPGQAVLLSIVLSGRDRTSIHRPELCLVGQGWTIKGSERHVFSDPSRPGRTVTAAVLQVEREVADKGGTAIVPQIVAYWFVSSEATVSSHWSRIFRDAWSRLVRLRADRWAYVLLQTGSEDGQARALERMQAVLNQTLPVFSK